MLRSLGSHFSTSSSQFGSTKAGATTNAVLSRRFANHDCNVPINCSVLPRPMWSARTQPLPSFTTRSYRNRMPRLWWGRSRSDNAASRRVSSSNFNPSRAGVTTCWSSRLALKALPPAAQRHGSRSHVHGGPAAAGFLPTSSANDGTGSSSESSSEEEFSSSLSCAAAHIILSVACESDLLARSYACAVRSCSGVGARCRNAQGSDPRNNTHQRCCTAVLRMLWVPCENPHLRSGYFPARSRAKRGVADRGDPYQGESKAPRRATCKTQSNTS